MAGADRFAGLAQGYKAFRPDYPQFLLDWLVARLAAGPKGAVLDIGSGTGIFTRLLAANLPPTFSVSGVELSDDMRQVASEGSTLSFVAGTAEAIPADNGSVVAVTAATAAHWFDRPRFYAEAARVLMPGGHLVVVDYRRDIDHSAAAAALLDFLSTQGEARAYAEPDYPAELQALADFSHFEQIVEPVVLHLTPQDYAGLALSSSHARPVLARHGAEAAERMLVDLAQSLLVEGKVPFGYLFRAFVVRKG